MTIAVLSGVQPEGAMKIMRRFQLKIAYYGLAWFALLTGVLQG